MLVLAVASIGWLYTKSNADAVNGVEWAVIFDCTLAELCDELRMKVESLQKNAEPSSTKFELTLGDCLYEMAKLPADAVDLVVTSPPYNLGIKYSAYQDDRRRETYLRWCGEWGAQIRRVLKPQGSFFLNVGSSPSNPMLPHELAELFARDLFRLQNTIHWIKSITIDDAATEAPFSRGHFKPLSSPRYLNDCHEYVFHLTKEGKTPIDRLAIGVPYADKSNIARWGHSAGRDLRCRGNIWFIPYKTIRDRRADRPHPATFPVALAENCIRLHAHGREEHLTMMDPFLGIGSAALAAQRLQVNRFIGFEVDESYLNLAAQKVGTVLRKPGKE